MSLVDSITVVPAGISCLGSLSASGLCMPALHLSLTLSGNVIWFEMSASLYDFAVLDSLFEVFATYLHFFRCLVLL